MSRMDEVLAALHDLILERFRATRGGDTGNAFVAFEFGTPIPDETFRLNDPNRTLSPEMAVEFLSQHANTAPEVKDMLFRRRPYTIDAQYGLMLGGASPVDAAGMEMLGAVKREAAAKYDPTLGSLAGPYRFRPVYATPVNWYDETDSGNWTQISIDRSSNPPPTDTGGKVNPELRMWRIAPEALRVALREPVSAATFQQMEVAPAMQRSTVSKRSRAALQMDRAAAVNAMAVSEVSATQSDTLRMAAAMPARRFPMESMARRATGRSSLFRESAVEPVERATSFTELTAGARGVELAALPASSKVGSLIGRDASWLLAKVIETTATKKEIVSDRFAISVEICMVNLHRPWLSDALLNLRGWFVPGYEKGEFSNAADEEDGPFAVLPTACILIRNLKIDAQWSHEDIAAMEQSTNFGSFNLFGRSIQRNEQNQVTLSVKGMQSIAWICEPMPVLPPAAAPPIPPIG
jgi:hypothetical protein